MNPNRLSIVFFAAALLLAGTAVAGLFVRLGAGTDLAQAVEARTGPPSFAGVLAAGSSSGAVARAPAGPAIATAPATATRALPAPARRLRARVARIRSRAEAVPSGVLLSATTAARDRALLRSRRQLVVVACPETREALRAAAAALAARKS